MWTEKNQIRLRKQAWMLRNLQKSSTKHPKLKIILKYLKLYCQYSSLPSFRYIADSERPWFERVLWIIIHCINISFLVFMVYGSIKDFLTTPLLTSVESETFQTTELNFPAIAICSINRISRQSATELATDIFKANITEQSVDEIRNLIQYLGNLYISNFQLDEDRDVEIDELLKTYYRGSYDIIEIMKNLSPHCSTILLKCKLHGTFRNCSQVFELRKTYNGYCCTFNYARESDDIPVMSDAIDPVYVHKVDDLGIDRGLTIVMDPLVDDYFYPMMPIMGWKIIVFNPTDYPDMTSGGVSEIIATPLTETYIDVTTTAFFSTPAIEYFPTDKRNCIFSNENGVYDGTIYTYSDCIVYCKINFIQQICGCRPFYYPRRGKKESKWFTILPHEDKDIIFKDKDVLHCYHCYPACDDVSYKVLSWKSYMAPGGYNTNLLWDYNVTNQGVLHVFFSKYGTTRLKQDVAFYWYEALSDIGGICGVFIGASLISVVELLYFLFLVFRELFCKKSVIQQDDDRTDEIPSVQTQIPSVETQQTIYWNELLPRSWESAKYGKFSTNRARY